MPQARSKRIAVNSIFSLLSWIAPVVLSLFVTPVLLKRLGNEAFGIYVVILGFIGYSFAFGIGRVAAKYVAEYRASGELKRVGDAVSSAFWLSLALGLVGAGIIALAARPIVTDVLQISGGNETIAVYALVLGGVSIPFTMLGQVFQNVLQGTHSFGRLSLLTNLYWILINVGNLALVIAGFGVTALLFWNLAVSMAMAAAYWFAAKSQAPEAAIRARPPREMFRAILRYGTSIFLYQLFGNILLLFERGWITRKFGAASATYYLVPMTLTLYMHGFIGSVALAAFPAFNELLNDRGRLVELYRRSTKAIVALTVFFGATLIASGSVFLRLWIDADFAEHAYPLLVIHTITFGLVAIMVITWQMNEAFHLASWNSWLTLIWAVIAIPAMIATVGGWGLEGVAASRLAGVAVTVPVILYAEHRFLGAIQWQSWAGTVVQVGAAAAGLAVLESFLLTRFAASWSLLMGANVVGTLVYCLILYLTGFIGGDELSLVRSIVRGGRETQDA